MKRILIALLVGAALFAVVFGAAASLGVDGGVIQAGSDTELRCDTDGVAVLGWGLETDDGMVSFVRIGGISSDCYGDDLFVNVTHEGTKISEGKGGTIGTAEVKVTLTPAVAAEDITDVAVFIEGP
jgi:hypothetical protein